MNDGIYFGVLLLCLVLSGIVYGIVIDTYDPLDEKLALAAFFALGSVIWPIALPIAIVLGLIMGIGALVRKMK